MVSSCFRISRMVKHVLHVCFSSSLLMQVLQKASKLEECGWRAYGV
jgi:hypothetical protein